MSPEPVSASDCRSRSENSPCWKCAAGKGMLHHGEADEQHDENEAAAERRLDDVVVEPAGDRQPRPEQPDENERPGRNQQDGTVIAIEAEIDDQQTGRVAAVRAKDSRAMPAAIDGS